MTTPQEEHLKHLNETFEKLNSKKYTAGAAEYGTNLWEQTVLQSAYALREEVIDQFNYVQTMIDNIERNIND